MTEKTQKSKQGIYLVANYKSESFCENLIYSIRKSGCLLPIRLIPFGGPPVKSAYILSEVEVYEISRFPAEAMDLVHYLRSVLTDCPLGFLYRFLSFYSDWEEFIYSDNDIVALMNWDNMFGYLKDYDFVHADEEYTTAGRFNYIEPLKIEHEFGKGALLSAFTAGHFAVRRSQFFIDDIKKAVDWFHQNPSIPKKHDQALLHVASLIGKWKILNLCRDPHNWLSPWAGDYKNTLSIIQAIQHNDRITPISHIHYSGGTPNGIEPIDDLLFAHAGADYRLRSIVFNGLKKLSGVSLLLLTKKRIKRRMQSLLKKSN